jgi:hypothetical protein
MKRRKRKDRRWLDRLRAMIGLPRIANWLDTTPSNVGLAS